MICPFAIQKLIPPGANDPRIVARVAVLHVAVSMTRSLFSFFRDRSGGVEAHFYIRWFGKIEQYRDTDFEADANFLANPFAVSIETAGWGTGRWNRRQKRSIERLLLWLNDAEGIPLVKCPKWDGAGVGYHIMFGSPGKWTPVAKSCPGPARIKQFGTWLVPWMAAQNEPEPKVWLPAIQARLVVLRAATGNEKRKTWLTEILRTVRRGPGETP